MTTTEYESFQERLVVYFQSANQRRHQISSLKVGYTHLGKRNFLHYAYRASQREYQVRKGVRQGMDSPAIRKQLARHFKIIIKSLYVKGSKRFAFKIASGKKVKLKKM